MAGTGPTVGVVAVGLRAASLGLWSLSVGSVGLAVLNGYLVSRYSNGENEPELLTPGPHETP